MTARSQSSRTAAATAANMLRAEQRAAQRLRDRGWVVISPARAARLPREVAEIISDDEGGDECATN